MVRGEFWITEANNGLVVKECDDEGVVISTVVYEGDTASAKLGDRAKRGVIIGNGDNR